MFFWSACQRRDKKTLFVVDKEKKTGTTKVEKKVDKKEGIVDKWKRSYRGDP